MKKVQFWAALSVMVILSQSVASLAETGMHPEHPNKPPHVSQPQPEADKLSAESHKHTLEKPRIRTREERIEERREKTHPQYKQKKHTQMENKSRETQKAPSPASQQQKKR